MWAMCIGPQVQLKPYASIAYTSFINIDRALRGNSALGISVRRDRAFADHVGVRTAFLYIPGRTDQDRGIGKGLKQKAIHAVREETVYGLPPLAVAALLVVVEDGAHAGKDAAYLPPPLPARTRSPHR